jgi:succinate-semialdehyde dehydrogenase/glutarate-semialdehyde dehydrogenase
MYIDGRWSNADDGSTFEVVNPATEDVFAHAVYGGRPEATRAVKAASREFPGWSRQTPYERAELLKGLCQAIRANLDPLARLLTQEVGKPLAESLGEVKGTADQFEWYSEEVKRAGGDVIPRKTAEKRFLTLKHPLGVVAAIAPWNFPLLLLSRKVAPALAAGCTVVGRPSIRAPVAVTELFRLIDEVGFPPGVVNMVLGNAEEQAEVFTGMDEVSKISFTGSSGVGRRLARKAAEGLKKISLELGGHAPYLIFDDVEPGVAARKAAYSKFRNMGQVCISPSRFYVHESIIDRFLSRVVEEVDGFRLGNGLEVGVTHGPLHSRGQVERTQALVEDILAKGGEIKTGGCTPPGTQRGYFFLPTIATRITKAMRIMQEEPFSPIMPVMPFGSEEEALRLANDTPYGLAAYVLTNRLPTAVRMCEGLEAGIIALNDTSPATSCCPFGGMKQSGSGREGWHEGLEAYYETKYVSLLLD